MISVLAWSFNLSVTLGDVMDLLAEVRYLNQPKSQVDTRFDEAYGVYWAFMNPRPRACFNMQLLSDLRAYIDTIVNNDGWVTHGGVRHRIQYGVLASRLP